MQKILLTTDFKSKSLEINTYAIRLYGSQVEYILLNGFVCDYAQAKNIEGESFSGPDDFRQYVHDKTVVSLEKECAALLELFPDIQIKVKAIEGVGIRAIESATQRYSPDLVVIGTGRLETAPTQTHATVATRLIGNLPTSILVVPYEHQSPTAKNIAFAYAQLDMNNDIYGPFKHLIKKAKNEITLFHVVEGERDIFSDEAIEDFANFLSIKKLKIENTRSRHAVESILTFCENSKPDLLVVIAREKTYRQDFWIGSKLDELSCQLRQPMLALYDAP